jgi:RNA polymerase sigma-70 factor (ECF subfamily)
VSERVVHPAPRPDAQHEAREAGRAIRDCLAAMVPARRRAVTLMLQGHSVPQTAGLLGWALKKTENLVYRGLADLRVCLRAKGIDR